MARGAWIADRLDGGWIEGEGGLRRVGPALGDIVPSGFDALIRVLHPFTRDHPVTRSWADYLRVQAGYEASGEWGELPEIRDESVTWREVAGAHGADPESGGVAPDQQAFHLLGFEHYGEQPDGTEINPDGWRYALPREGSPGAGVLANVAAVLTAHTATPGRGVAAVWEGCADLVSAQGVAYFGWVEEPKSSLPAWLRWLRQWWFNRTLGFRVFRRRFGTRAALHAQFLPGVQQPAGSGLLPKHAAAGPRLELPDRAYVCFEAGIRDFTDEAWRDRAPWIDTQSPFAEDQTPNVIWPEDRAWFLISEIDFDSTLIACSRACADSLLTAPGIEAVEITRDTPLWDMHD